MSSENDRPLYTRRRVIGLSAAALGATAAARVIPAFGAQGSTIDSYNWSGARVVSDVLPLLFPQNISPPKPEFFTRVKATWKVPKVRLHGSKKDLRSATWVGLDGGTWGLEDSKPNVLLAGIYHKIGSNGAEYTPFFGLETGASTPSSGDVYLTSSFQRTSHLKVNAGDTITVELIYTPGSGGPNTAKATFTRVGDSETLTIPNPANIPPIPPIDDKIITGYTVEWIFERISSNNDSSKPYKGSYYELGNHDAVVFKDAEAETNLNNWVSPDDGDSINMRDVDDWPTLLTAGVALSGEVQVNRR